MRQIKKQREVALVVAFVVGSSLVGVGPASASLIFDQIVDLKGTGIGAVDTILTIQETGRGDGVESGFVSWNGTTDVTGGPDVKTGASQTQTIVALGSADALRIIFNPNEGGNQNDKAITLDNLVLTLFSSSGLSLFTSGSFSPVAFPDAGQGTGTSGFAFKLDLAQANSLSLALSGAGPGARYGLSAQASLANGGPETFFIEQKELSPVPLPGALPLFASGLGVISWFARRKKQKAVVA